jgi:uncharacterized protein (DUF3820 family)
MKITFGKHKGEDIADVPTSYLDWLLEEYDPKNEYEERFLDAVLRESQWRDDHDGHFED